MKEGNELLKEEFRIIDLSKRLKEQNEYAEAQPPPSYYPS